jgi:hypothetical protein
MGFAEPRLGMELVGPPRCATSRRPAPYFLKVYGLNGPEVRGHALKCP